MGIYFSHRSGGPVWSRDRGYHQPDPWPAHIWRSVTRKKSNNREGTGDVSPEAGATPDSAPSRDNE